MNQHILDFIEENAPPMYGMADTIFDDPELGLKEYHACAMLTDWLREHDFEVECPVGGLETAFRAQYQHGVGGPTIGLLCEYDALPMGHACGHHMQGPIMLLAAQALRCAGPEQPYRLVIYGTPGEEGLQGKVKMIAGGCFKDLDVALMTHAAPNTTVDVKSLAGSKWTALFKGVAAHESLTPELVRSGLDAMILAFQGIEFLKGHVKEDVKFYCTVNECSATPGCTDKSSASCNVMLRTYHAEDIAGIEERMLAVFQGAAMMTGTTVTCEQLSATMGKLPSYSLNGLLMKNAEALDAPQRLPFRERTGSTDFAEVTHLLPGAVSRFAFVPEGSTSHSQAFLDAGKSDRAHEGIKLSAKIIASTAAELICDNALLETVKTEFQQAKARYEASI